MDYGGVTPARNEESAILYTIKRVLKTNHQTKLIVVVDDYNTDRTLVIAEREGALVIRLTR